MAGLAVVLWSGLAPATASAAGGIVRIGVMNDQSSVYADTAGRGSVIAAQMAVEDALAAMGGSVGGRKVEVVSADHQNKPDLGSSIARKWFDEEKVDAVFDIVNSGVALAVQEVAKAADKVVVNVGSSLADLYGKSCTPVTAMWMWDTNALAKGLAEVIVGEGGKSWYFITVDYSFGLALEKATSAVVAERGGTVAGAVRHPLGSTDFASYLLQAQASRAGIVGMANAGIDTVNLIKQAAEFGMRGGPQQLAALIFSIHNVHGLGLEAAQGLRYVEPFYWNADAGRRDWSLRFQARNGGKYPSADHAYVYSSVRHYLKAVAAASTTGGAAVMAKMKELPVEDVIVGKAALRPDGRLANDLYLVQVKAPGKLKEPWDYLEIKARIAGDAVLPPLKDSACPLVTAGR